MAGNNSLTADKPGTEEKLGLDYPVLGKIVRSRQNYLATGRIAGNIEVEKNYQVKELPIFALGQPGESGARDLFFCYFEDQLANMELLQLGTDRSDLYQNSVFLEDLTSDNYFTAIRLGNVKNGQMNMFPGTTMIKPNIYLSPAPDNTVEQFVKRDQEYSWVYTLSYYNPDFLVTLSPLIAMKLKDIRGFEPVLYCQKVFEIITSGKRFPLGHLVKVINDIYSACDLPVPAGYALESKGNEISIASSKPHDISKNPLLETSNSHNGQKMVVQCKRGLGLRTQAQKFVIIDKGNELITQGSGVAPGAPFYPVTWQSLQSFFYPQQKSVLTIPAGFVMGVEFAKGDYPEFPIMLVPGETSLNACIAGVTRSGKTNFIKELLLTFAMHDYQVQEGYYKYNRIGALVFDKQGEFAAAYREVMQSIPHLAPFIEILEPEAEMASRLRLEDISLVTLVEESTAQSPDVTLLNMIKWAVKTKDIPGVEYRGKQVKKMNASLLNYFLNGATQQDWAEFCKETKYQKINVDAVIRQLRKLEDSSLASVVQLEFDGEEIKQPVIDNPRSANLLARVFGAQRQGKILIIDLSRIPGFSSQSRAINVLRSVILKDLEKDRQDQRLKLGEKKFRDEMPIFFIVNEEATAEMYSRSADEVQAWIDAVTQANKHLLGNIFIFQSTRKIDPLVLSQLAGFSVIFRISQQADRDILMKSAAMRNITDFEETVADLETGYAVAACQLLQSRGLKIMVPPWEWFVTDLLLDKKKFKPGVL